MDFHKKIIKIGDSAFSCCYGLTSITISNSVKSIGDSACYACVGLTSVIFDKNSKLKSIGKEVFYNCVNMLLIKQLLLK